MARNMSQAIFSLLLMFLLRLHSVARSQTCTVGDHADSTRFGLEFVFGLPVSGQYSSYLGDYGNFVQTTNSGGTNFYAARPARSESGVFATYGMPSHKKLTYTAETSVTRNTGLHDGTLRVLPDYNLIMYLFGSNTNEGTYGATTVIPLEFLGQEYFASVLAGPGLGQVVISSTGETTFIRLTPNGPFTYDGITYSSPFSDLEVEIPAWYQMIITTSSNDFIGSRILANKTVSVLSGSSCAYSPEIGSGSCDYAMEHLLPYDKWGTTFNVPPFQDGSTGYYVQITAGRDDTTINVDGTLVSLGQGQTESREVTTNAMLRITSDNPIQVVQILKGAASMVVIPPEEQYTAMTSYFRISGADSLSIYLNHYFTIVVPCSSQSGIYVTGTAPGDSVYLKTSFSSAAKGAMCAYFYTGGQTYTYTISQSDPDGAFIVLNYGRDGTAAAGDGTAGYAYVGAQKFQTQRCLDYHTIIYGSETTTTQATTTQATTTQATTTQATTTQATTTQATTTKATTAQATTSQATTTQATTTQATTTQATTTKATTTQATTIQATTTTSTTTETPSTTPVAPARKSSSNFCLRFTDKNVASSKHIETVEGRTSHVRCAQQCLGTLNCQSFTWVKANQRCVLSGSIDSPTDLVQEVGVNVFVRS